MRPGCSRQQDHQSVVEDLATEHNDVRLRPATEAEEQPSAPTGLGPASATASPDDRLEQALGELRQSVAGELVEMLAQVSPAFFEKLVLDLLHRMGYGTSRSDLKQVGGVGEGGSTASFPSTASGWRRSTSRRSGGRTRSGAPRFRRSTEVGVSLRPLKVPKLDVDYFEE